MLALELSMTKLLFFPVFPFFFFVDDFNKRNISFSFHNIKLEQ